MTAVRSQHKLANAPAAAAKSGIMETLKSPAVVATAIGSAIPLAAQAIEAGWGAFKAHRDQAMGYKSMLDMHPHLRQEKPEQVTRVYNSVFRANPHAATDPFVAGSIVTQIVQASNHIDPSEGGRAFLTEYDRLISQRAALGRAGGGHKPWSQAVGEGAKEVVGVIGHEIGARGELRSYKAKQENEAQVRAQDAELKNIQDAHRRMMEEQRLHAASLDAAAERSERATGTEANRDPGLGRLMSAVDRYTHPDYVGKGEPAAGTGPRQVVRSGGAGRSWSSGR